jgi:hypothetical protein
MPRRVPPTRPAVEWSTLEIDSGARPEFLQALL